MAGTLVIDTVKSSTSGPPAFQNSSGVEIGQLCRAWVNFVGSTATIRASFNVSSVTRNATGDYTVNFTNALADTNYGWSYSAGDATSVSFAGVVKAFTTSSLRVLGQGGTGTAFDYSFNGVSVFR